MCRVIQVASVLSFARPRFWDSGFRRLQVEGFGFQGLGCFLFGGFRVPGFQASFRAVGFVFRRAWD